MKNAVQYKEREPSVDVCTTTIPFLASNTLFAWTFVDIIEKRVAVVISAVLILLVFTYALLNSKCKLNVK